MEPMKGSVRFHRWAILSIVSATLERRVWLDRGRQGILFPNTYTLFVGRPATGKSWAAEKAIDFLKLIRCDGRPPLFFASNKITPAALYEELKASSRVIQAGNHGKIETSPIFIYASELSLTMTDFGGGTLTNELIDIYDSKSMTATLQKHTIKGGVPLTLRNPSLTLLGCTNVDFLQQAAKMHLITSGLSSRLLFVVEDKVVEKEFGPIIRDDVAFNAIVTKLNQIFLMQGRMTMDQDAEECFIAIAKDSHERGSSVSEAFYQHYYGRKPDHVAKTAMLFAAIRGKYNVNLNDIERARHWIEELEPTMIKAFGLRSIEKDEDGVSHILNVMDDAFVTKGEILRRLTLGGKFMPEGYILENTLKSLITSGLIQTQSNGSNATYTLYRKA